MPQIIVSDLVTELINCEITLINKKTRKISALY